MPSRVYVGVLVFGIIACLVIIPYTAIVLGGYVPPDDSPLVFFEPPTDAGQQTFLVLASVFSLGFTLAAWQALLAGAREDVRRRKARQKAIDDAKEFRRQQARKKSPPGYT